MAIQKENVVNLGAVANVAALFCMEIKRPEPKTISLPVAGCDVRVHPATAKHLEPAAEMAQKTGTSVQMCAVFLAGVELNGEKLRFDEIESLSLGDYSLILAASMGLGNE